MAKKTDTKILVNTVFDGKQTDTQAFIRLIACKNNIVKKKLNIDKSQTVCYNESREKL